MASTDVKSFEEGVQYLASKAIMPLEDGDYEIGLDTFRKLYIVVRVLQPKYHLEPPDTEYDSILYAYFLSHLDEMIQILSESGVLPWRPEADSAGVRL